MRCERWQGVVSAIAQLQLVPDKLSKYRALRIDPLAGEAPHIHHYLIEQIRIGEQDPYALIDALLDGSWLDHCVASLGQWRGADKTDRN